MPKARTDAAQHIQGGVSKIVDMEFHTSIDTKHELKELVETAPHRVFFFATAQFPPQKGMTMQVHELKQGQKLVIVGPDPYKARNWYANIERKPSGQLRVT